MSESSQNQQRQGRPFNFSLIVSGLFVVIIALLAVLWKSERSARIGAEQDLAKMLQEYRLRGEQQTLHAELGRMLAARRAQTVAPFGREDLVATKKMDLNGKDRQVLEINAEAGQRLGFRAGDVIVVSEAPTARTQPAGAASTPPRP